MPKGLRDIKTSTGAKAKRLLPPKLNISVGRRSSMVRKTINRKEARDWDGDVSKHIFRRIKMQPPTIFINWARTFECEIERLRTEIIECNKSVCEGIAGSEKFQSQLENRLAFLQKIFEMF